MKKLLTLIFIILSTFAPVFCANVYDFMDKIQKGYKTELEKTVVKNYMPSFSINSDKIKPKEILVKLKVNSDGTIIKAEIVKNTEPRLGKGVLDFLNKTKQIDPIGYNIDYYVLLCFQDKQNEKHVVYVNTNENSIETYTAEREWQFKRLETFSEKLSKCKMKGEEVIFVSTEPGGKISNVSFEDKSGNKKELQNELKRIIDEIKFEPLPFKTERRFYLTVFSYKNDGNTAKIAPVYDHPYLKIEWGPYMRKLETKIKNNWNPPKDAVSKRVVVIYTLKADGNIEDIKVTSSSGNKEADEAAVNAIKKSSPVEPLPQEFPAKSVDIEFTFDYNVLYGGGGNFSKPQKSMYTCTDGSCNTNPNQFGTHLHY